MLKIALLTFILILLNSCTVEKRVYQKGFHVEWNKRNTSEDASAAKEFSPGRTIDRNEKPETRETIALNGEIIPGTRTEGSDSEDVPEVLTPERLDAAVADQLINEDTVIVIGKPAVVTEEVDPRVMKNYSLATLAFGLLLIFLMVLVVVGIFSANTFIEMFFLALLLVLFIFVFFAMLVIRAAFRPDRALEKTLKKEEYKRREAEGTFTEEEIAGNEKKRTKAIIFFSVFFGVIGTIIFIVASTN